MLGEDIGWYPLDLGRITLLLIEMSIVILLPGFIAFKALFKEVTEPYEQVVISFFLGISPVFVIALFNITFNTPITAFTMFCAILLLIFISVAYHLKDSVRSGHTKTEGLPEVTTTQVATE